MWIHYCLFIWIPPIYDQTQGFRVVFLILQIILLYFNDNVSLELVYVGWVFWWLSLWQFQSHSKLYFILESFFVVYVSPFQCFCLFVSCCFSYTLSMFFFFNLLGLRVLMMFNLFIYLLCSHLVFNILLLFISISNLL